MNESAVRAIERWGLVSGVTGVVANLLLIALYALALPGNESYDWTGPANDVIGGVVSSGALIVVAFALRDLVGGGALIRWLTVAAAAGLAVTVVLSLLLVADVIPFEVQAAGAVPAIVVMFVWLGFVGRAGAVTGVLPLARWAVVMGILQPVSAVIVGISLLLPWESIPQYVVGGLGLVIGVPVYLAFPVWLIVVSNRVREHQESWPAT